MGEPDRHLKTETKLVGCALLLLVTGVLLTGCSGAPTIAAVEPTPTLYPPPPTDIPAPPPGPTPEALDFPLPPPTHESPAVADDQTCIACHTDEEILKALSTDEEAGESLSEGEG